MNSRMFIVPESFVLKAINSNHQLKAQSEAPVTSETNFQYEAQNQAGGFKVLKTENVTTPRP